MRPNLNINSLYAILFQISSDAVFILDLAGHFLDVNQTALERLGYTREEMLAMHISQLDPPEYSAKVPVRLEELTRCGHIIFESAHLRKDGSIMPVEVNSKIIELDGVQVILSCIRDISERKQLDNLRLEAMQQLEWMVQKRTAELRYEVDEHKKAAAALVESNILFENVFDISLPICITDLNYDVLHANRQYYAVFNQTLPSEEKTKCFKSRPGVLCHTEKCPMKRIVQGEEVVVTESTKFNAQGDGYYYYIITGRPFRDSDGQLIGIVESFQDITNLKLAHRERDIMEASLLQSQKMAAIGTLAGGIAHDFNNLLNVILGYTDILMLEIPAEDPTYQSLKEIRRAGRQSAELVNQILSFSRGSELQKTPLLVQGVLKETLILLRRSLPTTIKIQQDIDLHCGHVLADKTQLHQVIINLCTNSLQAMQDQNGTLSIKISEVEIDVEKAKMFSNLKTGRYIELAISDIGCGMDPDTTIRIFEPYFTTKEQGRGTGLGLFIVHGIIKNLDGEIIVQSRVGQGTTFILYLPVIDVEVSRPSVAGEERKALPQVNARVLFVDDVEYNVLLGRSVLERIGCEVVGMTSSREALKMFEAAPDDFDIVVTDQTMPDLTGCELARHLLAIRSDIPIFMLTGHNDFVNKEKAKAIGIREFFAKPIDIFRVAEAVNRSVLSAGDG